MKVADLVERRRANWRLLETMCLEMESRRRRKRSAEAAVRFAALYRAACADLALADAYQLPPGTVDYLHQLVGRAHNQFYRSRMFHLAAWRREMFYGVPQRLFADRCFWLAMTLFWSFFFLSVLLAHNSPAYIEAVVGQERMQMFDDMYRNAPRGRAGDMNSAMVGFYIQNNIGIALQCFAFGLIFGVGGLFATAYNAIFIGGVVGYMINTRNAPHFLEFVTAHGPFELTAIVLAAAAGMRLGFSLINTGGLSRMAALEQAAPRAMPAAGAAMVLLFFAALIEGFVSPSELPYGGKLAVAIVSALLLILYFIGLGIPRRVQRAT